MSSRSMRHAFAAGAGAVLLTGAMLVPSVHVTDAAFTDTEYTKGQFTAQTLQTPAVASCTAHTLLNLGIVFTGFTIVWTSVYDANGVQLLINNVVVPASNIQRSGSGPYTYTAQISLSTLQSIVQGLLGSTNTVTVRAVYPGSTWTSAAVTRTLRIGGVLGLLGPNNCTT